jgi:hypothetical protein
MRAAVSVELVASIFRAEGENVYWLNSGNACCHSVQNILSPRLLSKNLKINPYPANVEYRVSSY